MEKYARQIRLTIRGFMTNRLLVFALEQESQNLFADDRILYTGVGKVNASYKLSSHIQKQRPSIVINLGTAGSSMLPSGTVVHSTKFIQRDMDATPLGFAKWVTPFSNEGHILEYGELISDLPHATCGSGDSFDTSHNQIDYEIVDMEAYALAKICRDENIPFVCLKYISDGADGQAHKDWAEALYQGSRALRHAYTQIISKFK